MKYPLSKNPVYLTIQGEGILIGAPMVFIRLAGCSVGCPLCDTDYRVDSRMDAHEIASWADSLWDCHPHKSKWAWVTGGEPLDHELEPLIAALREKSFYTAVATAGEKEVPAQLWSLWCDFLSVSPHTPQWKQRLGSEIKLVPGLNGYSLKDFGPELDRAWFGMRYVQPCDGKPETVQECVEWVKQNPLWRMTPQAHKQWGLA